jgi:hypothetical protein
LFRIVASTKLVPVRSLCGTTTARQGIDVGQEFRKTRARDRFFQCADDAHAIGIGHLRYRRQHGRAQGAHNDDRDVRQRPAKVANQSHPVHLRHVEVADHQPRHGTFDEQRKCCTAVGRLEYGFRAQCPQHAHEDATLEVVVFDDENRVAQTHWPVPPRA